MSGQRDIRLLLADVDGTLVTQEKVLTDEMKIDQAARQKIASQRKIIVEGSQEWDILYRKYYNDEVRKLGL